MQKFIQRGEAMLRLASVACQSSLCVTPPSHRSLCFKSAHGRYNGGRSQKSHSDLFAACTRVSDDFLCDGTMHSLVSERYKENAGQ